MLNQKNLFTGFTLIELLVVVALIGILAAIGIQAYSGYIESAKKKEADVTLQSIYMAQQEYKSNNGEYYISSNTNNIVQNLFEGVDDLSEQDYTYVISRSGTGFCIRASKAGVDSLYLNHLKSKNSCWKHFNYEKD